MNASSESWTPFFLRSLLVICLCGPAARAEGAPPDASADRLSAVQRDLAGHQSVVVDPDWTAESNLLNANLGYSVASAGDVNGDGYNDVIVGAPTFDMTTGLAHVYLGSATGPATTPDWTATGDQDFGGFGWSVATAGDVNGDGYSDVIVGAPLYEGGAFGEGAAFVYLGSASGLSLTPAWAAQGDQGSSYFGFFVATAGDVNGDGYSDVVVGAYNYDNGEQDEGRAFVYLGSATGLASAPAWTAEGNQADAKFGASVALAGDVNGDGYSDIIVGAPKFGTTNGFEDAGRAYLYLGSATGLEPAPAWTVDGEQERSSFALSVSTAGDVNGDGYSDVIVGAHSQDTDIADGGRVYVYFGSAEGLSAAPGWTVDGNQSKAGFGMSVFTAGDVNGDGCSDVVVGAYDYDNGEQDEGRAFVYLGSPTGPPTAPAMVMVSSWRNAWLGWSVATAGDVNGDGYSDVIVGAPLYDNGEAGEGAAFVYFGARRFPATDLHRQLAPEPPGFVER